MRNWIWYGHRAIAIAYVAWLALWAMSQIGVKLPETVVTFEDALIFSSSMAFGVFCGWLAGREKTPNWVKERQ